MNERMNGRSVLFHKTPFVAKLTIIWLVGNFVLVIISRTRLWISLVCLKNIYFEFKIIKLYFAQILEFCWFPVDLILEKNILAKIKAKRVNDANYGHQKVMFFRKWNRKKKERKKNRSKIDVAIFFLHSDAISPAERLSFWSKQEKGKRFWFLVFFWRESCILGTFHFFASSSSYLVWGQDHVLYST
jgi:hypothetical protein